MTHNLTWTLAAWHDYIWLVVVAAVMIGSAIGNFKKKMQEQRKRDEGPHALELEEMAARRREELRQMTQHRAQTPSQAGGMSGGSEPGNMTMAERIARARAKAQYEKRATHPDTNRPTTPTQPQAQTELQGRQRAIAQQQAELQRRRQAILAQQQAQQQAQQRARLQAQQQAQALAQQQLAQAQLRRPSQLVHQQVDDTPTQSTTHRMLTDQPSPANTSRAGKPIQVLRMQSQPGTSWSRNDLRRAIVMNEVLGKPLALR